MNRLIVCFAFAAAIWAQPTCTSPAVDDIGPTWARLRVTTDQAISYTRVVYGGVTVGVDQATSTPAGYVFATIGGLTPNTAYSATLQASANGSSWCTGSASSFTTLAASTWSPTAPTAVSPDPRTTPATTGTTRTAVTCADIQTMLAASVPGDKLVIPASLTCAQSDFTGNSLSLGTSNAQLNARGWYKLTAIDAATDTFTRAGHGMSNGTLIRFGFYNTYGRVPKGMNAAVDYYVVNAATDTFQVSTTPGGSAVDVLDVPFSNPAEVIYQSGAVPSGEILIVGSDDASLPPAGVRVSASTASIMPTLTATMSDDTPLLDLRLAPSPVRVRGIHFSCAVPANSGDADPGACSFLIWSASSMRRATIERNVFDMPAMYPYREKKTAIQIDGSNNAVIDNYISLAQWRPWNKGLNLSLNSGALVIAAGDYFLGHKKCSTSQATATMTSGSASGTAYAWLDTNCAITVQVPSGYTGTCTNCTLTTAASPAYPSSGNSYTAWPIGTAGIATTFQWVLKAQIYDMVKATTESGSMVSMTWGPGPLLIDNNYILDSPGVTVFSDGVHYDNPIGIPCDGDPTCGPIEVGDWTVTNNVIEYTNATIQPDDGSQTLRQFTHRNAIEAKDCRRCKISGNQILNNYKSLNAGPAITLTPLTVGKTETAPSRVTVRDTEVSGNFMTSASGIIVTGRYPGPTDIGYVSARVLIENNIVSTNPAIAAPHSGTAPVGALYLGHGPQSITYANNTLQMLGSPGVWMQVGCIPATVATRNNLIMGNNADSYGGALWQNCAATNNSAPLNTLLTAGDLFSNSGAIGGLGTDNVFIGGYGTDGTTALTQAQTTTLAARYSSATWAAGETIAARVTAAGRYGTYWYGLAGSTRAGAQITDAPVDILGNVQAFPASTTSVTAWWNAPNTNGCWVDRSTDGVTFTGATQATPALRQTATLTGLTTKTAYTIRVRCGSSTKTATTRTN